MVEEEDLVETVEYKSLIVSSHLCTGLTSMLGWLVACSTLVSDTVFAMMFLQIRST